MVKKITTRFTDSEGIDLGSKLVTKEYLLEVYPNLIDTNKINNSPNLWLWGDNTSGEMGAGDNIKRSTPITTILTTPNWATISCGFNHALGIKTNGSLWLWGSNGPGQLGVNDNVSRSTPVTTLTTGTDWKLVRGGGAFSGGIKNDGSLWIWGTNTNGQLGANLSTLSPRSTPITTLLEDKNWKTISFGFTHVLAIKSNGSLWAWGDGPGCGTLNPQDDRFTPTTTLLGGFNWKSIAAGTGFNLAVKTDGSLWVWGLNAVGQLGVNDILPRSTPCTTVLGGTNWKSVFSTGNRSGAIKTDGTLWIWGKNTNGDVGIGTTSLGISVPTTTILGGNNWKSVGFGQSHFGAIKTDGSLWMCGENIDGMLGINDNIIRSTPVTTILGGNNWKSYVAGSDFSMAIQSEFYI